LRKSNRKSTAKNRCAMKAAAKAEHSYYLLRSRSAGVPPTVLQSRWINDVSTR
jgi:hypothetical protein